MRGKYFSFESTPKHKQVGNLPDRNRFRITSQYIDRIIKQCGKAV